MNSRREETIWGAVGPAGASAEMVCFSISGSFTVFIHCAAVPHQQMPLFSLLMAKGSIHFHSGTQDRFYGS